MTSNVSTTQLLKSLDTSGQHQQADDSKSSMPVADQYHHHIDSKSQETETQATTPTIDDMPFPLLPPFLEGEHPPTAVVKAIGPDNAASSNTPPVALPPISSGNPRTVLNNLVQHIGLSAQYYDEFSPRVTPT
uniref:Uncharacterized protein n=1 Tax=Moniliophthora roreri TaxID=221103 RepID=A0A0W0FNY9_MONRR